MALDEPKDADETMDSAGVTFMVDSQTRDVLAQSGGLTIDYIDEAYRRGYMLKLGNAGDCGDGGGGGCEGCGSA
jgi:Fe-S cluster assembly iron-binding protein IscA